jgi:hypothetical protein
MRDLRRSALRAKVRRAARDSRDTDCIVYLFVQWNG